MSCCFVQFFVFIKVKNEEKRDGTVFSVTTCCSITSQRSLQTLKLFVSVWKTYVEDARAPPSPEYCTPFRFLGQWNLTDVEKVEYAAHCSPNPRNLSFLLYRLKKSFREPMSFKQLGVEGLRAFLSFSLQLPELSNASWGTWRKVPNTKIIAYKTPSPLTHALCRTFSGASRDNCDMMNGVPKSAVG